MDEVLDDVRIALVQIGHGGHKPSVDGFLQVYFRCVWVEHRREFVAGLQILGVGFRAIWHAGLLVTPRAGAFLEPLRLIQPIVRGQLFEPRMFKSAVVENHVHHHFKPLSVGFVNELAVFLVGAKARVYFIIICRGISVVGAEAVGVGRIVLQYGCEP